jgi:preprotein translocase subunit SecA
MLPIIGEWLQRGLVALFGSRNQRLLEELLPAVEAINALEPALAKLSDRALRDKTAELRKKVDEARKSGGYDRLMEEWRRLKLEARREEAVEAKKRAAAVEQAALDSVLVEAFALVREASKRTNGQRHYDVQLIGGIVLHQGKISEMVTGEGKTLVATLPAYLNALAGHGVHIVTVNDYLARRDRDWNAPIFELLGLNVGVIQQPMDSYERQREYACDITYGTNNEFGFDYLRDNMKVARERQCQGPLHYAIVDEVDSILIDEARTPLIISGEAEQATEKYGIADKVARQLKNGVHFEVKEKEHLIILSEEGTDEAQRLVGLATGAGPDFDFYTGGNMDWPHHIDQALRAHHLYEKDVDYVVKDGEIVIVDEFTGRLMPGRTWSDGLHQAIEAKEGVTIKKETQTLATVTFQNFFRLYTKIAGMTGTAQTEAEELHSIYKLDVVSIPTNRPLIRESWPDVVYRTEREKFKAIVDEIDRVHQTGRPILVGTIAIEKSEKLSKMLHARGIKHEVLNAKHHEKEAMIVAKAGQLRRVTVATNMAGRGTDIILGAAPRDGDDHGQLLEWVGEVFHAPGMKRLRPDDYRGMGKDELRAAMRERVAEGFERRLEEWRGKTKAKVERKDLDGKTDVERRRAIDKALKAAGHKDEVERFRLGEPVVTLCEAADDVERCFDHGVAGMGGLHVLGTERHEARRIDNQLRGRCGRQGDPGSSQFFLSLEDDLMRIFAPERVSRILESLGMTEGQEISHGMVTRAIERAQRKVEARNFDIRKNLLEYDQVMDEQRKLVYEQRQNILEGGDTKVMALEMVREAVSEAVERFCSDEIVESERNYAGLVEWARSKLETDDKVDIDAAALKGKPGEEIEERLFAVAKDLHGKREKQQGEEAMRHLEHFILLQKIDEKWKDHLHGMDQLRSGIGLRGYAQIDPKIAYKKDGFELFQTMIGSVHEEVASLLFKVRLVSAAEEAELLGRLWRQANPVASGPAKRAGAPAAAPAFRGQGLMPPGARPGQAHPPGAPPAPPAAAPRAPGAPPQPATRAPSPALPFGMGLGVGLSMGGGGGVEAYGHEGTLSGPIPIPEGLDLAAAAPPSVAIPGAAPEAVPANVVPTRPIAGAPGRGARRGGGADGEGEDAEIEAHAAAREAAEEAAMAIAAAIAGDESGAVPAAAAAATVPSDLEKRAAAEGAAAAKRAMQRALDARERASLAASQTSTEPRGPVKAAKQIGRNDPCPCGSGKKYKKCCGA